MYNKIKKNDNKQFIKKLIEEIKSIIKIEKARVFLS